MCMVKDKNIKCVFPPIQNTPGQQLTRNEASLDKLLWLKLLQPHFLQWIEASKRSFAHFFPFVVSNKLLFFCNFSKSWFGKVISSYWTWEIKMASIFHQACTEIFICFSTVQCQLKSNRTVTYEPGFMFQRDSQSLWSPSSKDVGS